MPMLAYGLLCLCLFVTIYDFRCRRVPNWITLPLILLGVAANFPGTPYLWMGSILLLSGWKLGWLGGGDVKLWIGLLWCSFSFAGEPVTLIMFITIVVTSLLQILVRVFFHKPVLGIKLPGAWRTLVFLLVVVGYSAAVFHNLNF